jgi:hypothetical protein
MGKRKYAIVRGFFALCFALSCPALFLSCSQSAPEIVFGSLELVYYENGGNPVERFTFFVLPRDDDGIENLDELWLYHDWEGLSWYLPGKEWVSQTVDGNTWIGTRSISMIDNSPLPRGQFRAVLVNKGGSRAERLITFDAPPEERPFPFLILRGDEYYIDSQYPQQNLLAYDNEGRYLTTITPSSLEGNVTSLGLPSQAESLSLWARDPARSVSAFTDIVPLRE